jgi:hypothetical protein
MWYARVDSNHRPLTITEATGGKTYLQNDIGGAILKADEAYRTNYTMGFYLADNERAEMFISSKCGPAMPD